MELLQGHKRKKVVLKEVNDKVGALIKPKVKTILRKRISDSRMLLPASKSSFSVVERSMFSDTKVNIF